MVPYTEAEDKDRAGVTMLTCRRHENAQLAGFPLQTVSMDD